MRLALDAARMATWDWDIASGDVIWNDEHYRILGYEPGTVKPCYEAWAERVHSEDLAATELHLRQSMKNGGDYMAEFRVAIPDGAVRWIEARGRYDRDSVGRAIRSYGVLLDITERKRAEEALRQAEERARFALQAGRMGTWDRMMPDGPTLWNEDHYRILGYRLGEVTPSKEAWEARVHPDDLGAFYEHVSSALQQGGDFSDELRIVWPDGTIRWVELRGCIQCDANGQPKRSCGVVLAFTERKRAEEALSQNQKTFTELVERAPFGIYVVDSHFRIAQMNVGSQNNAFRNVRPVIGRDFTEVMRTLWPEPVAAEIIARFRHTLETGEPYYSRDFINPRLDVETVEAYEWELHRMMLPDGQCGVICYYFDSTKLREAEQALRQSEERFRALFEHSMDAIIQVDPQGGGKVLAANPAACRLLGWTEEELKGQGREVMLDVNDEALNAFINERERVGAVRSELNYRRKDGATFIGEVSTALFHDQNGTPNAIAIVRDVTERKQAQESLRQLNEQLEQRVAERTAELVKAGEKVHAERQRFLDVLETLPVVITLLRPDHRVEWGNRAYREALGDNVGKLCYASQFGRDKPCEECEAFIPLQTGQPQNWQWTLPNGRTFDIYNFPFADADGSPMILEMDIDITDRKAAEAELARHHDHLEALVQARTEELQQSRERLDWVLSTTGVGHWLNTMPLGGLNWDERTRELFFVPPGVEPTIELFWARLHPEDREPTRLAVEAALRDRTLYAIDHRAINPETGAIRWIHSSGQATYAADGAPIRFDGINYDITERKQTEEALRDANEQLRQADRRKDEFLATLAHELRNPLAPVRYAVQILRMAGLNEEARQRQQNIIDRQMTHMARLLDDLLDVSRVTRGKVELRSQPLCLADVLAHVADTARPTCEARHQQLHFTPPPADLHVEGDIDRLEQVVGNLLVNASKFTGEGGQIWLEAAREQDQAVICVRDTGVGITPELLPRIFDLFVQADDPRHRSQGGLGIGLTLVRSLVEMHGGAVEARSGGKGLGSEFIIRLPVLSDGETDEPVPSMALPKAPDSRIRRILVVDDIADSAVSLAELLALWGHDARAVHDGLAAIETVREWRPEIVLLDIGMPGIDGYETARRLRAEHVRNGLMLVALTGFGQEADREAAREAGFDAHLIKPVDITSLRALLAQLSD